MSAGAGSSRRWLAAVFVPLAAALALVSFNVWNQTSANRVVVYCALDPEFSRQILDQFELRSGLKVDARFDSEANKSVGLYEDLVREAEAPKCDVHWNNEILATIRLQNQGLYEAYPTPASTPFPKVFQSKDHTWTAFAARARVLLINTRLIKKSEAPTSILELTDPRWRGRIAMAKPQFGTTATHVACLFQVWGADKAKEFLTKLSDNVVVLPGNKQVAVAVGNGDISMGLTDTDDAIAEVDAGKLVAIIFLDKDAKSGSKLGTLYIPNTVAIMKGCPNVDGARKLVEFLLNPEVEARLAKSPSKQIPLNPGVQAVLPPEILTPLSARPMPVDFRAAADDWEEAQRFVSRLFAAKS